MNHQDVNPSARVIRITLPYPPSSNRLWANMRGRMVKTSDARAYVASVAAAAHKAGIVQPLEGAISVKVLVYRPRRAGDLDNRLKAVLDALQGIAYENDEQVVHIEASRFDDKANPRVEVELSVREVQA